MHEHWRSQIPFYVAGTLSTDETAAITEHLSNCEACAELAREWHMLKQTVRQEAHQRVKHLPPLTIRLPQTGKHIPEFGLRVRLLAIAAGMACVLLSIVLLSRTPVLSFTQQVVTPTIVPSPVETPLPVEYHSAGYTPELQYWNNNGPAALTIVLRRFDISSTQREIAAVLKPNRDDRHVRPDEIATYVNDRTPLRALVRVAGDTNTIKRLLVSDIAVITQIGIIFPDEGWFSHYVTPIGYDDQQGAIYLGDPWRGFGEDGRGVVQDYRDFDKGWWQFNRVYIVIYPAEQQARVEAILGQNMDEHYNAQHAVDVSRDAASQNLGDALAWYNLGSSYLQSKASRTGQDTTESAVIAFSRAQAVTQQVGYRLLWYRTEILEAYWLNYHYDEVMSLAGEIIRTTPYVEEAFFWRGMAYSALGDNTMAIQDFEQAVTINPNYTQAVQQLERLRRLQPSEETRQDKPAATSEMF
jgi:hypothetical protein